MAADQNMVSMETSCQVIKHSPTSSSLSSESEKERYLHHHCLQVLQEIVVELYLLELHGQRGP